MKAHNTKKFLTLLSMLVASSMLIAAESNIDAVDYEHLSSAEIAHVVKQSLLNASASAKFEYDQAMATSRYHDSPAAMLAGVYAEVLGPMLEMSSPAFSSNVNESNLLINVMQSKFLNALFQDSNIINRDAHGIVYELNSEMCDELDEMFAGADAVEHSPLYDVCVNFLSKRKVQVLMKYQNDKTLLLVRFGLNRTDETKMYDVVLTSLGNTTLGQAYYLDGMFVFFNALHEDFPSLSEVVDIKKLDGELSWEYNFDYRHNRKASQARSTIVVNIAKKIDFEAAAQEMNGGFTWDSSPFEHPTLKIIVDNNSQYTANLNAGKFQIDFAQMLAIKTGRFACGVKLTDKVEISGLSLEKDATEFSSKVFVSEPTHGSLNINNGECVSKINLDPSNNLLEISKFGFAVKLVKEVSNVLEEFSVTCMPKEGTETVKFTIDPKETSEEHEAHGHVIRQTIKIDGSMLNGLETSTCKRGGLAIEQGSVNVFVRLNNEELNISNSLTAEEGQVLDWGDGSFADSGSEEENDDTNTIR